MTSGKLLQLLVTIISFFVTGACKSISHVRDFADNAAKANGLYGEIAFSATSYCHETFCIDPKGLLSGRIVETPGCSCKDFSDADKTIRQLNTTLLDYFQGLSALSDKHATTVSFSDLTTAVSSISGNTKVGISDSEIKATGDLSSGISSILVSTRRRKQLRKIISSSDASVKTIVGLQQRNMDYLINILHLQDEETRTIIQSMIERSPEPGVQYLLRLELNRRIQENARQQQLLKKYNEALQKIEEGHRQMFEHNESLKDTEFRKKLRDIAASLRVLYMDFENARK